jgi:hypothetical protein
MWQWDNHYEHIVVSYCIAALTQLGTNEAIKNIKSIAVNSMIFDYDYAIGEWIYLDVVQGLTNLKRIKELIELILADKKTNNLIIGSLKKFTPEEVNTEIDKFFELSLEESEIEILKRLKAKVWQ